ncbi:MAG: hypothetical protein DRJ51_02680 [Thermoprotei archaeon]|nr:MAG: hypothetical protein DRJ51_02680 [Thermoprotei archaeon]RLF02833.1 MAG: hypothetical protein DRJ59_02480 [Thermoprotei archaeon]
MSLSEKYLPWIMHARGRVLYEFYFTVANRPGELRRVLEVFSRYSVNLLSLSAYAFPEEERAPVFAFADLTGLDIDVEKIKRDLEFVTGEEVYFKASPAKGFMMEEFGFPLYTFPGVRSMILLESDFKEMLRGLYEKFSDAAGVYLYYMAFSGGKYIAKYMSEKLGLRGWDLLVEVLKYYQASGWARVELVECNPEAFRVVLRMYDSVECSTFRGAYKPMSHFIRGHLSGLLSGLLGTDVRFIETKCVAAGDPYCEFFMEKL